MYWATSFCEREHSSKRAWMYLDRLWCSLVPFAGGARLGSIGVVATRFIGGSVRRLRPAILPGIGFQWRSRVDPMRALAT